jgi:glutathione S-transferase
MALTLYIGNKNYSSWSMRPWVLMRQVGIVFEEVMVRFDGFGPESQFKQTMRALHPSAKVPVLLDGDLVIWDSLAIAEYLADRFPQHGLWPQSPRARARARSVCAEMHSGFADLRRACPMNIEAKLPEVGERVWREDPRVREDLQRLVKMWTALLNESGGPMLFGTFGIADAFYAPVVMRLRTYALPVPEVIADYAQRVAALAAVQDWVRQALAEQDFREFEEPYRGAP